MHIIPSLKLQELRISKNACLSYIESNTCLFLIPVVSSCRANKWSILKELWEELHQKATVWYAEHGQFDDARFHAMASGNLKFAANLLEEHGRMMLLQSQFISFRH